MLGLGDTNYTKFCQGAKAVDAKLKGSGAKVILAPCMADDATGLEDDIEPWLLKLWTALEPFKGGVGEAEAATVVKAAASEAAVEAFGLAASPAKGGACSNGILQEAERKEGVSAAVFDQRNPFHGKVTCSSLLTSEVADHKLTIHMEIDISGSGITYSAGDAFGLVPPNDEEEVEKVLRGLGLDGDAVIAADSCPAPLCSTLTKSHCHRQLPCSLFSALTHSEMVCVRKSLLSFLSTKAEAPQDKDRLEQIADDDDYLKSYRPRLVDLLRECPSIKLTAEEVAHCLTPSQPRFYSVASSPLEHPNTIHIAFSVVDWETPDGQSRGGVCTSWLRRCHETLHYAEMLAAKGFSAPPSPATPTPKPECTIKIPLFLRPSSEFRMPADPATPMICICAGTGIAPFRGFFAHRAAMVAAGSVDKASLGLSWLLFGCKSKFVDYLYCDDLANFQKEGYLTHNHVAFSLSDVSSRGPFGLYMCWVPI